MHANRLPAAAGLRWIAEAFAIFRVGPVRQLAFSLLFLIVVTILLSLRGVGFVLVWLLMPAFLVGPHAVARAAEAGGVAPMATLIEGFRVARATQLRVGGIYLAGMGLVLLATVPADGGRFAQAMMGIAPLDIAELQSAELQQAMLIGAGLQTALFGALWYAPLLVAWKGQPAVKAVFFSTAAALINWRPFLLYGVAFMLLFMAVLMLAIAGAVMLGGYRALQANAALLAVVWTLLPVWFASSYASYRAVFESDNTDKSPTMQP